MLESLLYVIKLAPVVAGGLSLESGVLDLARPAFFAGLRESGLLMVTFHTDVMPPIFVYFSGAEHFPRALGRI